MYKKQLSSNLTFIAKVILPGLFVTGITGAIIGLTSSGQYDGVLGAFLALLVFSPLIYMGLVRLKRVSIDNQYIYISNYIKTIQVPITDLQEVDDTWLLNYHPIWITFRTETPFGKVVMFMPSTDPTSIFSTHPITRELRELIKNTCLNAKKIPHTQR
ncbi:hypothetical protein LVD17_01795 [Fulvivirga ulvae]|uniref:hypothetical protein n=1 Tax=Fulvivirga ulvae TaxID=2904245 RepID=UPI001F42C4FB|nr:hypothetical protein [Fulvivirga ulvae]UII32572.1 hypothetical protein LVD17_01795 [Fulvivirga ulvae]